MSNVESLVTPAWLFGRLEDPAIKPVDASWFLPPIDRDPRAAYAAAHISGAVYFDIDEIADTTSGLPHTLPSADHFAEAVGSLGIGNQNHVVAYDALGIFSAPRAWWLFQVFGHDRVSVLDGGLPAWRSGGYPLTADPTQITPTHFTAALQPSLLTRIDDVRDALGPGGRQIVDVRGPGRFNATEPEPRPGVRGGHMPGAKNLPYSELLTQDGSFLPVDELAERIKAAGIEPDTEVISTCGSGVTACILSLGLHLTGHEKWSVYDGSWSEWGSRTDTPVETSPE